MAQSLRMFLGRRAELARAFAAPPFAGAVLLPRGMIATPLTDTVLGALGPREDWPVPLLDAGARLSAAGPVVHLGLESWAGSGTLEVIGWRGGQRTHALCHGEGPLVCPEATESLTAFSDAMMDLFGWDELAVDPHFEFDLGRWRMTDDMAAGIGRGPGLPLGVILAGGQARRMGGGDKSFLRVAGRPILDHVIARLTPQVHDMALNANGDPARFEVFGLPVIPDSVEGYAGPLAGVLAGLDWAAGQGAAQIVTVAADTPFFPPDLVARLQAAAAEEGTPIALAATPDPARGVIRHPTFGLWPVALRDDLRAALAEGVRKVVAWTDRHGTGQAMFGEGAPSPSFPEPFFNVNTPEDLQTARRMMESFAAGGAAIPGGGETT